jgi:toxin FitB
VNYLVDTNVLSELRKEERCHERVAAWWSTTTKDEIFLSVLTIGEIRRGIKRIRRRDEQSALEIEHWLFLILDDYKDRIIPVDLEIAEEWAGLGVPDPLPAVDALLAATAKVRGLTLVTRNVSDIARTGVAFLNPWNS